MEKDFFENCFMSREEASYVENFKWLVEHGIFPAESDWSWPTQTFEGRVSVNGESFLAKAEYFSAENKWRLIFQFLNRELVDYFIFNQAGKDFDEKYYVEAGSPEKAFLKAIEIVRVAVEPKEV